MNLIDNLLKNWFGGFLARRHATALFGRRALLHTVAGRGAAEPMPEQVSRDMLKAASDDLAGVLVRAASHEDGLSAPEAAERLARVGPNEVEHEKPLPWWMHLWHCYKNPFNLLLTVLAGVSYATEDVKATVVIGTMVGLSTLIRFVQEGRSNRAAERLKAMVSNTATVIRRDLGTEAAEVADKYFDLHLHSRRPPQRAEVPIRDLVPGDHVVLSAGDMIPADCRLMTAKDLFVAQAAMTGESLPVEKFAERRRSFDSVLEAGNLVFMGTNVVSGAATALIFLSFLTLDF